MLACRRPASKGSRVIITPELSDGAAQLHQHRHRHGVLAQPGRAARLIGLEVVDRGHTVCTARASASAWVTLGTVVYRPAPLKPGRSSEFDELRTNTP